jgi:hypothetical protein
MKNPRATASAHHEEEDDMTDVYYDGELFGTIVEDVAKLKKADLIEAIQNYGRDVVHCPDGGFDMIDAESGEYEFKDDD